MIWNVRAETQPPREREAVQLARVRRTLAWVRERVAFYRERLPAAEPAGLYRAASGDVAAAFRRTASRLIEMRSPAYLHAAHRAPTDAAGGTARPLAPEHQSG